MRKRFIFLGVLGVVAAMVSCLPLSWIAPHFMPKGIGQDIQYTGTIWQGQVHGLDHLGRASFQLKPKAFITSELPLSFATSSPAMSISGEASRKLITNLRFNGVLAKLPTRDGRLKELEGTVDIRLAELNIENKSCASASGQITTDFLTLNQARWQWRGPTLAGPISCENGDMIVNLSGQENRQIIRADLHLSKDGRYSANIAVQTPQPEAGVVLPLYGFELQGRDYKLTEQGQWR